MILAIDIGNTNIVVGCIDGERICFVERISTDRSRTELEYAISLKTLLEINKIPVESITGTIIGSVVPPLNNILKRAVVKVCGQNPIMVGPGVKTGLNISMDDPTQVGADLIADAVAGLHYYGAPLIIIDMGTATTICVLDKKKSFIGGMILPGVKISLESLVNGTSQLPRISLDAPKNIIAKNTIDSMKAGIVIGQAACIDGIIDRTLEELGYDAKVIATGGLSSAIIPHCRHKVPYDNELTLKGLNLIYQKTVK